MHTHTHTHTHTQNVIKCCILGSLPSCTKYPIFTVQFCMVVDVILGEVRSILGESDEFLIKKRSVWRI